jgi:hypothetical protein
MAPNGICLTDTTDLSGATNVTTSDWFIVIDNVTGERKNDSFPEILKNKQQFGKPQKLIGVCLPSQKLPYLNYRRNSARM